MLQAGAAITDWCLGLTTLICAERLGTWRKDKDAGSRDAPRWESCLRWSWLCETFACGVGGFTWAWGTNLLPQAQLTVRDYALVVGTVLGMAGEGLFLAASGVALDPRASAACARSWRGFAAAGLGAVVVYEAACLGAIYRYSIFGAPALLPAAAPLLGQLPVIWACRAPRSDGVDRRLLGAGAVLNLLGILLIAVLDNDCAGENAITENAPWEDSPPRFVKSGGQSCPLPAHFNHAAVMHITNIVGNGLILAGLSGASSGPSAAPPDAPRAAVGKPPRTEPPAAGAAPPRARRRTPRVQ